MRITKAVSSSELDWFTSCRAIDAMVVFNTPFRGQQELSLIGAEQTTSSLVVMIDNELITVTTEKVLSKCCQDTPYNPKNRCKYSTFLLKVSWGKPIFAHFDG